MFSLIKRFDGRGGNCDCSWWGESPWRQADGTLEGVEAVIDKDLASSLLASSIGADEFYILTDVPYVYLNFKKPNQKTPSRVKCSRSLGGTP